MDIKKIRGQLRIIAQELLPELLTTELKSAMYDRLTAVITARLSAIEKDIRATMDEINNRSKETQDYIIRNTSAPILKVGEEPKTE